MCLVRVTILVLVFCAAAGSARVRYSPEGAGGDQYCCSNYDDSAGAAGETASLVLDVREYPGDGPAGLVSNAVPFKPGVLFDERFVRVMDAEVEIPIATRVLARWPRDNSIRSLLIQFEASARPYTLDIGMGRQTPDRAFTPVTWDLPARIFVLPAEYLSASLVFWEQKPLGQSGFPLWETKQLYYYPRIETIGTSACVRDDQYYDAITTTYQLYARTGELKYLVNARRWALHHRRDQIYLDGPNIGHPRCPGAYINNTRYTFPEGLISDYFMFGDEEDKRVSGIVVDNFYMPHADSFYYKAPNTRGWWTEREPAFSLIGILAHYQVTGESSYLDKVRQRVASLRQMQLDNGRRAWVHNLYDHDPSEGCSESDWGSSPWMSGLLLEALATYHKLTDDPAARESILMALDDLKGRYLATTGQWANVSYVYLGCPVYTGGEPDLDNMIAHAFAYGYKLTGSPEYLKVGTDIFRTSVRYGITPSHKHYDQQFRSSGHFAAYLGDRPAIGAVVNAASYSGDVVCTPGGLASIFGTLLARSGVGVPDVLPLPTSLNEVQVKAGDIPLPLLYVSPQQINFQCPDLGPGQRASITVEANGQASAAVDVRIETSPGLFSIDATGTGQGAIKVANTDEFAMPVNSVLPGRPVQRGEYISIYATGLGRVRNPVPLGHPGPMNADSTLETPTYVTIGGVDAQVTYSGLAPRYVGLYQVNARVPGSAPAGDAVPVIVSVADASGVLHASNAVTIAVAQ